MQQYAEEAVFEHLKNLQKEFFKGKKDQENAPFVDITPEQTQQIMNQAMKNSERWRKMDLNGKTEDEIVKSFSVPAKMKIFTYNGERDTIMTPRRFSLGIHGSLRWNDYLIDFVYLSQKQIHCYTRGETNWRKTKSS